MFGKKKNENKNKNKNERYEISGIDMAEFQNQRRKMILKSGKYCSLEVLVGENDPMPICRMNIRKTNAEDMSKLFLSTMSMLKECMKKFPIEFLNALMNLDEGVTAVSNTHPHSNDAEDEEYEES